MLFEPHAMDAWIGAQVSEDQTAGGFRDMATGKLLSQRRTASYKAFCKRHTQRCRMGDAVDRYLRLVDKYQPKVFAEARIYVAKFPQQVGELLKQIKKVRKKVRKMRKRRRRRSRANQMGDAVPLATSADAPHGEGGSREGDQQAGPAQTTGDEHVKKGDDNTVHENVREETPPHRIGGAVLTTQLLPTSGRGEGQGARLIGGIARATWHRGPTSQVPGDPSA